VPDAPSAAGDELAALRVASARLREANARLRQVVEAKDTEIAALRAAMEVGQARQAGGGAGDRCGISRRCA